MLSLIKGWWIDGIGIDDFRTSPLCKRDSLFRLVPPEYSQHDNPPHQSGPRNWRFDRTLVEQWRRWSKGEFVFNGRMANDKIRAFLPSVHAYALTVPARVEIIYFKQVKSTIFACKWIALRSNWWSWSVSPKITFKEKTRSSWFNCALRDDEALCWVSIGHYEALAVGNWWYWVRRGHLCLYILHKVEIWKGVTHTWQTDRLTTLKDRATQLLIKFKTGALVTQWLS